MAEHRSEMHQLTDAAKAASKISKILASGAKGGTAAAAAETAVQYKGVVIGAAIASSVLPVLFLLLLPAAIFNGLMNPPDAETGTILNNDLAIVENVVSIRSGILETLLEAHDLVLAEVIQEQKALDYTELDDSIAEALAFDALNILSVYSSYQAVEDYTLINIEDLNEQVASHKEDYFFYDTSTEIRQVEVEIAAGGHYDENDIYVEDTEIVLADREFTIFTIKYIGDSYFSETLWPVTDAEALTAAEYASNLISFLYEIEEREGIAILGEISDMLGDSEVPVPSGVLGNPFNDSGWRTHITSRFGLRTLPGRGTADHNGLDIAYGFGTPIYAVQSGKVITAKYHPSYGNYCVIDHGGGICTLYAHCSKLCVSAGTTVAKYQKIAEVGSTGDSSGNHLHICYIVNGQYMNPELYLH